METEDYCAEIRDWPDTALIRQWWYVYLRLLKYGGSHRPLNALTREGERRQVIRPGIPMTRKGAEDLADQCDEVRRKW